jgi:hypothetical protein
MARISGGMGPSNADVTKETTLLTQQGAVGSNGKPQIWSTWKAT